MHLDAEDKLLAGKGIAMLMKFATQVDTELLAELRLMARRDGRQLQALIGDALQAYVDSRLQRQVRREVQAAMAGTLKDFAGVYEGLMKYEKRSGR